MREEFDPAESWSVHLYERRATPLFRVRLEPGEHAVGVVPRGPALVVLASNRRQFYLVGERARETIYAAPRAVTRISVCPVSAQMALLSADGTLAVYELHSLSLRLSVVPAGGDPQ